MKWLVAIGSMAFAFVLVGSMASALILAATAFAVVQLILGGMLMLSSRSEHRTQGFQDFVRAAAEIVATAGVIAFAGLTLQMIVAMTVGSKGLLAAACGWLFEGSGYNRLALYGALIWVCISYLLVNRRRLLANGASGQTDGPAVFAWAIVSAFLLWPRGR